MGKRGNDQWGAKSSLFFIESSILMGQNFFIGSATTGFFPGIITGTFGNYI